MNPARPFRNPPPRSLGAAGFVAYPPGGDFLLLPRSPTRATRAGLALYEAVEWRQRLVLRAGGALMWVGGHRLAPQATHARIDWAWWSRLFEEVAEPLVGTVEHVAFRIPGSSRIAALLADRRGRPIGFVKITDGPRSALAVHMDRAIAASPPATFVAPRTLADRQLDGVSFRVLTPLPEGAHRPPPLDPDRVRAVMDEFHARLQDVPRPAGTPSHHVPCHGDLTPRNLRVLADRRWSLFDWDTARFGPRLADELRYWSAALVYRRASNTPKLTARLLSLLRERGDDREIREATEWSGALRKTYRPAEQVLQAAVGDAVRGA